MENMIFFDIDGTLLDHEKAEYAGAIGFKKAHAVFDSYKEEEFYALWHDTAEKHMNRFISGELTYQGQRQERLKELFGTVSRKIENDEADEMFAYYLEKYEEHWCLYPDIMDCLKELAHLDLGIISNGGHVQQRKKLNRTGIDTYFKTVVISTDINCGKPEREIFEYACELAGVNSKDCFYIGDRLETDAKAACDVGMKGVWLNRKNEQGSAEGVVEIRNLDELPKVVKDF
jgi:putative hydrolase of the HAD superfamily